MGHHMRKWTAFTLLALTLALAIPAFIAAPAQACEGGKDGK
jgi:hypothetical protein